MRNKDDFVSPAGDPKVEWKNGEMPNTDKVGSSTKTVETTYKTMDENGNIIDVKNSTKVPVVVTDKPLTTADGKEIKKEADKVVNTINLWDETSNQLIGRYGLQGNSQEWHDTHDFDENQDQDDPTDNVDKVLSALGYELDQDKMGSAYTDYNNFSNTDQVFTRYYIEKGATKNADGSIDVKPILKENLESEYNAFDIHNGIDPAYFVGNLGVLPKGTKVDWDKAPEFDKHEGDYVLSTEDPTIKVTLPNGESYILGGTNTRSLKDLIDESLAISNEAYDAIDITPIIGGILYKDKVGNDVSKLIVNYDKLENKSASWNIIPIGVADRSLAILDYGNLNGMTYILLKNPTNETKTVTETIHYQYEDGTQAADSITQTITFTKHDDDAWKPVNGTFNSVTSPAIEGYTADKSVIDSQTVNHSSENLSFVVTYKKNGNPGNKDPEKKPDDKTPDVTPSQPTSNPQTSTAQPQPEVQPSAPATEENTPAPAPHATKTPAKLAAKKINKKAPKKYETAPLNGGEKGKTNNHGAGNVRPLSIKAPAKQNKSVQAVVNNGKQELPQTGEKQNSFVAVLGAAIAAVASFFGLASRRKNN